jgi:hypothetical protein
LFRYFLDKDGALNYNLYISVGGQALKHHLVCKMHQVQTSPAGQNVEDSSGKLD